MSFDSLDPLTRQRIPTAVKPKLYFGSYTASRNFDFIENQKISHILTVANDIDPEYPSNCKYKIVDVDDWHEEDLSKYFIDCFEFIDQGMQGGGVLVHDLAGISRSPTVVIGYLMWKEGLSLAEAYSLVKEKRPTIFPNQGFFAQLSQLEQQLNLARGVPSLAPVSIPAALPTTVSAT